MSSVPKDKLTENEAFLRITSQPDKTHSRKGASCAGGPASSHSNPALGARPEDAAPPHLSPSIRMQLKQWPHFAVVAIQLDSPAAGNASQPLGQAIEELLAEAEKKHQALWFRWRDDLYVCAIAGWQTASASDFGLQMQDLLAQKRVETVTIGITQFPLKEFSRAQSLANACKALDHAAFFGPGSLAEFDAVTLNISGDQHYQAGDLNGAMTEYQAALALDPENVNVINSLGVCLARQHHLGKALVAFTRVIELDPGEAMAIYNAGMIRLLQDESQEALDYFEKAFDLDSETFEIAFQAGKLLAGQQRWDKARTYLEHAITLNSTSASAHCLLGECLAALEQMPDAIGAYTKAVKLNPNDATALSALGMLYAAKGENPDIYMTFCRQSVALEPENGLFRDRLARLHLAQEQWEAALIEFERASALGRDCAGQIDQVRRQLQRSPQTKKRCA